MTDGNNIKFTVEKPEYLDKVENEQQLLLLPGYLDITIDDEGLTRKNGVKVLNDDWIILFAMSFLSKLIEWLDARNGPIRIDYGDYWQIVLDRKEGFVYLSIYDNIDKEFVFRDKKLPENIFFKEIITAAYELERILRRNENLYFKGLGYDVPGKIGRHTDHLWYIAHREHGIFTDEESHTYFLEFCEPDNYLSVLTKDLINKYDK